MSASDRPSCEGGMVYLADLELPHDRTFGRCITESRGLQAPSLTSLPAGLVREMPVVGAYSYAPPVAELIDRLRSTFRSMGHRLGFEEWLFPRLLAENVLEKFGWVHDMPSSLVRFGGPTSDDELHGYLDPVQCSSFYVLLERGLADGSVALPWKVMESGGTSTRNEPVAELSPLSRAREFLRTEFVFAGVPEEVATTRCSLAQTLCGILTEWGWTWRLTIGAGCYDIPPPSARERIANANSIGDLPTYDVEAWDPEAHAWLELAGCTDFLDSKVRRFGIDTPSLHSGCVGVGLTRLARLMILYHGLNPDRWPCGHSGVSLGREHR